MQDFFNNFFDRPYRTLQYPARNYAKSIEVNNDSYTLMIRKFMKGVSEQMIDIIIKQHSIPEEEALDFIEYMISMNDKRKIEVEEIVEKCYKNGNSKLECAKILLDKYYKITKINVYNDKSENEEISEVSEGINNYLKVYYYPSLHKESYQTEIQKPTASLSLFINFITKLKDLDVKFIFNTKLINGVSNSLNTEGYNFYIETKPINNKDVEFEFKYSRTLSSVLKSFDMYKNMTNDISFYIGIDKSNFLNFGYIINNQKIKIGFLKYKTQDIIKISDIIESSDKSIDFKLLSQRFLSTLSIIQYYKKIFNDYLQNYDDDIEVYTSIIDNKIAVVIESINPDVINKNYLNSIIVNNKYYVLPVQYEYEINTTKINNKLYYYFTIKK